MSDYWQTEFFQKHYQAAHDAYVNRLSDCFQRMQRELAPHFESPLEASFAAWWAAVTDDMVGICPQKQVEIGGESYRLDFVFELVIGDVFLQFGSHPKPKIALELDGHEFHEKTKEQVTYRNRRDRALQMDGWTVLHVSGSEFNQDPAVCVRELHDKVYGMFCEAYNAIDIA